MWRLRIIGLIVILTGLSAQTVTAQGVRWRTDLEAAKREAARSGRLVLLHFWAKWCRPCMKLEHTVFNQPRVAAALERHYVPVKVNVDLRGSIAKEYRVWQFPTDLVITPSGRKVGEWTGGFLPADEYVVKLTRVAVDAGRRAGSSRNSPRFGQPFSGDPTQATPEPRENSSGNGPRSPDFIHPAQYSPQHQRQAPAERAPLHVQRPGLPPLGFDGYCLISMHQRNVWIKGDPKWGAIHEGRLYYFANQSARDLFLSDYSRFAPVLSSFDAVLFIENGRRVHGKRAYGVTYQAPGENGPRIYLFASEATLQLFGRNPLPYVGRLKQLQRRNISQQRLRGDFQ